MGELIEGFLVGDQTEGFLVGVVVVGTFVIVVVGTFVIVVVGTVLGFIVGFLLGLGHRGLGQGHRGPGQEGIPKATCDPMITDAITALKQMNFMV